MSIIEDFKKQFSGESNDIEDNALPWTNLENQKNEEKSKKILPSKKLATYGLIGLVTIILVVGGYNYFTNKATVSLAKSSSSDTEEELNTKIQVHVAGEVLNPGVYKLDSGSRIIDAINMAGGFTEKADKNSLNLAKTVDDGEQIMINSIAENNGVTNEPQTQSTNGKININTADLALLQTLNGVGPSTAQKIIDYRSTNGKFKTIEDLKKVSGIGEKTFAKFKDQICV